MEKEKQTQQGLDIMDRYVSVLKCAELTGINYTWLRNQVKSGRYPDRHRRDDHVRYQVIPREVLEWYDRITAG